MNKNEIRLLVLWNTAGIMSQVVERLNKTGHQAKVLMRYKYDPFHVTRNTEGAIMVDTAGEYYAELKKLLREFDPTHIHINGQVKSLVMCRWRVPRTPIIFQYHGGEIRSREKAHPEMSLADRVYGSTPDLVRWAKDGWLGRPIPDWFYDRGGRVLGTALMAYASFWHGDTRPLAYEWCRYRNIKLTVMNRDEDKPTPYSEMPELLSKYEYYLDFKGTGTTAVLSKQALEAIKCGCKVVHDSSFNTTIEDYDYASVDDYIDVYHSLKKLSLGSFLRRIPRLLVSFPKMKLSKLGITPLRPGSRYSEVEHFWEKRYKAGKDSGKGSVGGYRRWKWKIIESYIKAKKHTVLDIGCGDLSFWSYRWTEPLKATGFDYSPTVIKKNKTKFGGANWQFFVGDAMTKFSLDYSPDIVLCIDVLFHIMDDTVFRTILHNLASMTYNYLFISTWSKKPYDWVTDNVFQYYRDLKLYLDDLAPLELVSEHTHLDGVNTMYVFRRTDR